MSIAKRHQVRKKTQVASVVVIHTGHFIDPVGVKHDMCEMDYMAVIKLFQGSIA